MAGFGLDPGEGFPEKLQAALKAKGHDVVIANAGVSGDTTSGGLSRLDWSVPDGTGSSSSNSAPTTCCAASRPTSPRRTSTRCWRRLKAARHPVLLAGMRAAPNLGPDYQASASTPSIRALPKKYGVALYPFFLDGVAGRPALAAGGRHASQAPRASTRMVERILPTVEKLIAANPDNS